MRTFIIALLAAGVLFAGCTGFEPAAPTVQPTVKPSLAPTVEPTAAPENDLAAVRAYQELMRKVFETEFALTLTAKGGVNDDASYYYYQKGPRFKYKSPSGDYYTDRESRKYVYCRAAECKNLEYNENQVESMPPGVVDFRSLSQAKSAGMTAAVSFTARKTIKGINADVQCFTLTVGEAASTSCFDKATGVMLYSNNPSTKTAYTASNYEAVVSDADVYPPNAMPTPTPASASPTPAAMASPAPAAPGAFSQEQVSRIEECLNASREFVKRYPREPSGAMYNNILLRALIIPVRYPVESEAVSTITSNLPTLEQEYTSSASSFSTTYGKVVSSYSTLVQSKTFSNLFKAIFTPRGTGKILSCKPI